MYNREWILLRKIEQSSALRIELKRKNAQVNLAYV
jgi:hypothetical protein